MITSDTDPRTEIAKEFRNSTDLSTIVTQVTQIEPTVDRQSYLSMKECFNCSTSLGKQTSKKYFCHFCYNAVCGSCSLLTILHPETSNQERACNICYLTYLKLKVIEIGENFVHNKLREELAEKEREIAKRKLLVEEIQQTRKNFELEKKNLALILAAKDEELKEIDGKAKEEERNNLKIKAMIETCITKGYIALEDYKTIAPDYKPQPKSSECLKCSLS
jgi:hypothetical protein